MTCKRTESMFSPYLDGRLSSEERGRLEEHLAGCQGCRDELRAWKAASAALRSQPAPAVPAGLAERAWRAALSRRQEPSFVEGFIYAGRRAALAGAFAAAVVWTGLFAWGGLEVIESRFDAEPQGVIEVAEMVWTAEVLP
ncbi:MAG: anti-sigma factor family protein [Myxococcales bacterium]|jgi:anti-sigma factor RsiW